MEHSRRQVPAKPVMCWLLVEKPLVIPVSYSEKGRADVVSGTVAWSDQTKP